MPTFLPALISTALAEEPTDPEAPGDAPPAPAGPTHDTPVYDQLRGTWFVTGVVDGREAVAWACTGHPPTVELDEGTLIVTAGAEPMGAAVKAAVARGDRLVLTTTLAACDEPAEVALSWADAGHHVLSIERCEGAPRTVRAVRDQASGVPVIRLCCDPSGKPLRHVGIEEACPAGYTGQKPTPLRR